MLGRMVTYIFYVDASRAEDGCLELTNRIDMIEGGMDDYFTL